MFLSLLASFGVSLLMFALSRKTAVHLSLGIYFLNRFTTFCSFSGKYKGLKTLLKINFTTVSISAGNTSDFLKRSVRQTCER